MTPKKKIRYSKTKKEKLVFILALISILILSFIVSIITTTQEFDSPLELLQTDSQRIVIVL